MKSSLVRLVVMLFMYVSAWPLAAQTDTLIDMRDGKTYKTVKIGDQVWMAENLAYAPKITLTNSRSMFDVYSWRDTSYYFCYADDILNVPKFGVLYSWEAAMNACPTGWHLPSKDEFKKLFATAGKNSNSAYLSLREGGDSGFEGKLAGELYKIDYTRHFNYNGRNTFFWTSTKVGCCDKMRAGLSGATKRAVLNTSIHIDAYSVRCIKDNGH